MAKELNLVSITDKLPMEELFKLGLTKQNSSEWYFTTMNKEEYEKFQGAYSKLTDSLIINSDNYLLSSFQKQLEKFGLTPLKTVEKEDLIPGTMFIFYLPVVN